MAKYFPALCLLLDSLENYSLCEKHYNHIIARKYFIEQLTKQDNSSLLNTEEIERKRRKLTDDHDISEKSFSDFGAQVCLLDPAHEMLVKRIDKLENINDYYQKMKYYEDSC